MPTYPTPMMQSKAEAWDRLVAYASEEFSDGEPCHSGADLVQLLFDLHSDMPASSQLWGILWVDPDDGQPGCTVWESEAAALRAMDNDMVEQENDYYNSTFGGEGIVGRGVDPETTFEYDKIVDVPGELHLWRDDGEVVYRIEPLSGPYRNGVHSPPDAFNRGHVEESSS